VDHSALTLKEEPWEDLIPRFYHQASLYLSQLKITDLLPGYVGLRTKRTSLEGEQLDFYIQHEKQSGFPGWINLLGIESPGLTASLAIGRYIKDMIHGEIHF
jgi:L-2-hydroxyglutarate oxidase LhgO